MPTDDFRLGAKGLKLDPDLTAIGIKTPAGQAFGRKVHSLLIRLLDGALNGVHFDAAKVLNVELIVILACLDDEPREALIAEFDPALLRERVDRVRAELMFAQEPAGSA